MRTSTTTRRSCSGCATGSSPATRVTSTPPRSRRPRPGPSRTAARSVLGLPESVHACLFDLDGVLTDTAKVHAAAWTQMFDAYLRDRAKRTGQPFVPFDPKQDYDEYVD